MQVEVVLALLLSFSSGAKADCPDLPDPEGTLITCTNGTIPGSVCGIECIPGLALLPQSDDPLQREITCLEDDTWDKPFPYCGQSCPPNAKADVVFVVDSSTSMRGVTSRLMRAFLREIIGEWRISSDNVNVAIVPYNRDVVPASVVLLNIYPDDKDGLLGAVDVLPRNGRGTSTGRALTYVNNFVFTPENGDRPDAPNIVVVMTDGRGQDRIDPPLAALLERGVTTYAVGFHPRRRMDLLTRQLMKIAQNNPSRMHLTERDGLGDVDLMMNHMKGVYCLEPAQCNPNLPLIPARGLMSCSNGNEVGSSCSFDCDEGFVLLGESASTCVAVDSGAFWTNPSPICEPDVCIPRRDSIDHGAVSCSDDNRVGSLCQFACTEPGYSLHPRNETAIICLPSTDWSGPEPCCARLCPPNAKMDAVLVLDSSSSIGAENWIIMTAFLRGILSSFTISSNATNFAVFRYNRNVDTASQILLSDYPDDMDGLLAAYDNIPYDGSGTFTGAAIQHVVDRILTAEAGDRPGFVDLVIVVTDGRAADDVLAPSEQLRATGATILVVGITPPRGRLDLDQLRQIAGFDSNLFVVEGGFRALDKTFGLQIAERACGDPCKR